jgi:hypothetical protein
MSAQDEVALSVRERQELAHLHSMLENADPSLARLLAGGGDAGPPAHRAARAAARRGAVLARRPWSGPLLLVAGLALILAGLLSTVWLSLPGALVASAGLALAFTALKRHLDARPPQARTSPPSA